MKPKSQEVDQGDLYRSRLDQLLNRQHPLFVLAGKIDWTAFTRSSVHCTLRRSVAHAADFFRRLAGVLTPSKG